MNSTGPVENWNNNPTEVGPLYPFVGWEMLMVVVCVAFFLAFMVWKFATENAKYAEQVQNLRASNDLPKAPDIESKDLPE
jgi:hypothetical protein